MTYYFWPAKKGGGGGGRGYIPTCPWFSLQFAPSYLKCGKQKLRRIAYLKGCGELHEKLYMNNGRKANFFLHFICKKRAHEILIWFVIINYYKVTLP